MSKVYEALHLSPMDACFESQLPRVHPPCLNIGVALVKRKDLFSICLVRRLVHWVRKILT